MISVFKEGPPKNDYLHRAIERPQQAAQQNKRTKANALSQLGTDEKTRTLATASFEMIFKAQLRRNDPNPGVIQGLNQQKCNGLSKALIIEANFLTNIPYPVPLTFRFIDAITKDLSDAFWIYNNIKHKPESAPHEKTFYGSQPNLKLAIMPNTTAKQGRQAYFQILFNHYVVYEVKVEKVGHKFASSNPKNRRNHNPYTQATDETQKRRVEIDYAKINQTFLESFPAEQLIPTDKKQKPEVSSEEKTPAPLSYFLLRNIAENARERINKNFESEDVICIE